ncbi:MAG: hypothetical protein Kow002_15420 [Anaerolineales bacterium]
MNKRMNQETTAQLKKIDWFNALPDEMLDALAQSVSVRQIAAGEFLFRKGDDGDSLFIIDAGMVKIVTEDAGGSEVILNQVGAGEIIGEMSLLDNEPRSAGVVAMTDTKVLELKRDDFMRVLRQQPDLALAVIRNFSSRMRYNTTYIEKIIEMSQRVANGDYTFIGETQPVQMKDASVSDQDKAGKLLSAFFQMVQGVKAREENLKQQVEKLSFEIDQAKRKQEFEEITGTEFYAKLKAQAKELRAKRMDNK